MNAKIYNGNVQPNPKEFKIWVNDEGTIKTWNGTEWVELSGGSGSGSGESNWRYFDISNSPDNVKTNLMSLFPYTIKSQTGIYPYSEFIGDTSYAIAFAVDSEAIILKNIEEELTWNEYVDGNDFASLNIIEITKEQFYNLEA